MDLYDCLVEFEKEEKIRSRNWEQIKNDVRKDVVAATELRAKEQSKMTLRANTIEKLCAVFEQPISRQDAIMKMPMGFENLPAALEALGLIEFERKKENSKDLVHAVASARGRTNLQDTESFLKELEKLGYKVVEEQA